MQIRWETSGSESWSAQTGDCTSAELKCTVFDAVSKGAAIQAVLNAAPAYYDGGTPDFALSRAALASGALVTSGGNITSGGVVVVDGGVVTTGLPLKEVRFDGYTGDNCMELTAVYSASSSQDDDGYDEETPTMSWDCGGGTKHVTRAIAHRPVFPNSGAVTSGGFVGWNGKPADACQINGVDIPAPSHRKTYTKVVPIAALTAAYEEAVGRLVGKVNNAPFKGWPKGSVMFDGANYSTPVKSRIKVVVTFNFHIQPNETNVVLGQSGNQTVTVSAEGFEYIDVRHKTVADATSKVPHIEIEAVQVDQVTEYGDFSALGL